jgi:vacuolar protein sorting-associated protein 16
MSSIHSWHSTDLFTVICDLYRLQRLGVEKLVQILTNRRHYGLAKSICQYMSLSLEPVLLHWACLQVKLPVADERVLLQTISDKLSDQAGISFAPVAKEAYSAGRIDLATRVI